MSEIAAAVAAGDDQPEVTFKALELLVKDTIGVRLFTLMEVDHVRGVARRSYSNMPQAYSTSGEKPLENDRWSQTVRDRHEIFVANSIEEIAEVFPDYELIQSLGCESCLNLPIVIGGVLRGTLNCLDVAGHYTPERIAAAETLKQPGALAFLMAAATRDEGENHG